MSPLFVTVAFALGCLVAVYGQNIVCPVCMDPLDPKSCNGTQDCPNNKDICELQVHTAFNNRLEYVCHNFHACTNHEAHACDPANHEVCAYCCTSLDACQAQLDELFSTIYTTGAPQPTSGSNQTDPGIIIG